MSVARPADVSASFARLFNARDKSGLLDLYVADAMLTVDGGAIARGRAEIEAMFTPMLAGTLKIDARCATCHAAGDVAIVRTEWTLRAPDGSVAMEGASAEVLQRGADGRWRFVIDDASFASRPAGP
jgi:uncharacterized protein (TIGR02246 family)